MPLLIILVAGLAAAEPAPVVQSLDVAAPFAPVLVRTEARSQLVYELHLTNFARKPARVTALAVVDADHDRTLLALEGQALGRLFAPATGQGTDDPRLIAPNARAVAYLAVPSPAAAVPKRLVHRLRVEVDGRQVDIALAAIEVGPRAAVVLSSPLRGGPWTAAYDPDLDQGHRRYVYAVGGQAKIPGRFAVDWFAAGPLSADTGATAADGSGSDVLAVADGVVVARRDDVADPAPGQARTRVELGDATGNFIALDLGDGRYAFYEHLQHGIAVQRGQRVRRGQVIARLGSTGQALRAHLHFHIANAPAPLDAEGLPFALRDYRVLGRFESIFDLDDGKAWHAAPSRSIDAGHAALPEPNEVVSFAPLRED